MGHFPVRLSHDEHYPPRRVHGPAVFPHSHALRGIQAGPRQERSVPCLASFRGLSPPRRIRFLYRRQGRRTCGDVLSDLSHLLHIVLQEVFLYSAGRAGILFLFSLERGGARLSPDNTWLRSRKREAPHADQYNQIPDNRLSHTLLFLPAVRVVRAFPGLAS